jgi:hypothetical protein
MLGFGTGMVPVLRMMTMMMMMVVVVVMMMAMRSTTMRVVRVMFWLRIEFVMTFERTTEVYKAMLINWIYTLMSLAIATMPILRKGVVPGTRLSSVRTKVGTISFLLWLGLRIGHERGSP